MPLQAYDSSNYKRLFINNPFIKGMYSTEQNLDEGTAKTLVNLDIDPSGSLGSPRNSLLNAFINTGLSYDKLMGASIQTRTQSNDTFIINNKNIINEYEFENKELKTMTTEEQTEYDKHPEGAFGIRIFKYSGYFKDNVRDYTQYQVLKDETYKWIDYVYDGDTIVLKRWKDLSTEEQGYWGNEGDYPYYDIEDEDGVKQAQSIRLLGIDTPELSDSGGATSKTNLDSWVSAQTLISIETEPLMPFNDIYGRRLSWVWGTATTDWADKTMANVEQRTYIDDNQDTQNTVWYDTLHYDMRYYDVMDTGNYDSFTDATDLTVDFVEASWYSKTMLDTYKDIVGEYVPFIDEQYIYDNESYFQEFTEPTKELDYYFDGTELVYDPVDWNNDDIKVEFLEKEYTSNNQGLKYISEVQKSHRNAVATIGRIVIKSKATEVESIRYQGLLTFQWDGEEFHILIIKPKEVNIGLWGTLDSSAYNFNILDDDPFVFVDYFGLDAYEAGYVVPMISGVTLYEGYSNNNELQHPKSQVAPTDNVVIYPYVAIPTVAEYDAYGYDIVIGEDTIINEDGTTINPISYDGTQRDYYPERRQYNFSKLASGEDTVKVNLYGGNTTSTSELIENVEYKYGRWGSGTQHITIDNYDYDSDTDTKYEVEIKILDDSNLAAVELFYFYHDYKGSDTKTEVFKTVDASGVGQTATFDIVTSGGKTFTVTYSYHADDNQYDYSNYICETYLEITPGPIVWVDDKILHTGYTGIIIIGQSRNIDENDEIGKYNVFTATEAVAFDRYTLYYGMEEHKHKIQFSLWDDDSMCPLPNGTIVMPEEVVHVHPHRNNIYIFGENNIWVMHSGFEPHEMLISKIQNNRSIEYHEKNTIKSVGSDVFFMSNKRGYLIRTNKYVTSQDDVFLIPVTTPVNNILYNPREFMSDRLENSWNRVFNQLEQEVETTTMVRTSNNIIDIITYNKIKEIQPENKTFYMYIIYQYDLITRRWTIYDTIFKEEPKMLIKYSNPLGFDLLTNNSIITSTWKAITNKFYKEKGNLDRAQRNHLQYDIGEVSSLTKTPDDSTKFYWAENGRNNDDENIRAIPVGIDSGNININPMHNKRFKKAYFEIINYGGQDVSFYFKFFMDNRNDGDGRTIKIERNEDGTVVAKYLFTPDVTLTVETQEVDGWSIDNLNVKEILKLEFDAKGKGRIPSFKMDVDATSKFSIGQYGLLFRQKSAK